MLSLFIDFQHMVLTHNSVMSDVGQQCGETRPKAKLVHNDPRKSFYFHSTVRYTCLKLKTFWIVSVVETEPNEHHMHCPLQPVSCSNIHRPSVGSSLSMQQPTTLTHEQTYSCHLSIETAFTHLSFWCWSACVGGITSGTPSGTLLIH